MAASLNDQAKSAMVSDPDRALVLARAAERRSAQLPQGRDRATAVATALWLQGEAKLRAGETEGVDALIDRAIATIANVRKPIKLRGDLLLTRGGLEIERSKPAEALASFQTAYRSFLEANELRGQALALQNMAVLYTTAGDYQRALRYYRNASEIYAGDASFKLYSSINLGAVLLQMDRHRQAIVEFSSALELARQIDSPSLQVTVATNLARALVDLGQLGKAGAAIQVGRRLVDLPEAEQARAKLDIVEAQLEYRRGRLSLAADLIERVFSGIDIAETPMMFRDAHVTAYNIYQATGNTALALRHLAAERRLEDEATKVAISTNSALMAARFDFANQELRIANLKAEELRQSVAFERQKAQAERLIFGGLAVATVIVLTLLSFGLFTIRRSRDQVRDANIVLGDTNIALEKALRAKTEFLATTSHEIRTPLNGILGMTQVMLADARIDAAMRDRIGVVHGAGLTMRSLVDDILDVAKMETGNLTVELAPIDLPATLREVCRIWEEQARGKGLSFDLDVTAAPGGIESDPARLRQIVFNLLSNAIKFTSEGGIVLSAALVGDCVRIAVTDTGIGIAEDRQAEIFESFKQVDAGTTRQFGGTGLGLTICRNLAIALGGDIAVTSAPGRGSIFVVTIPYRPATLDASGDVGGLSASTLIVLDRNPIARSMLRAVLEPRCGCVEFIGEHAEFLAAIEGEMVDRVLIDETTLKALGDDPVALLAEMVAQADAAAVASAVLWARPDAAVAADLAATGVGQVIAKPIAGTALAELLVPRSSASGKHPLVSRAA